MTYSIEPDPNTPELEVSNIHFVRSDKQHPGYTQYGCPYISDIVDVLEEIPVVIILVPPSWISSWHYVGWFVGVYPANESYSIHRSPGEYLKKEDAVWWAMDRLARPIDSVMSETLAMIRLLMAKEKE